MKKLLIFIAVLVIIVGTVGYMWFKKPNESEDLEKANNIVETNDSSTLKSASEDIRERANNYTLKTKNGETITAKDLFIQTDNGTYFPKDSVISQLDNESISTVINDVLSNERVPIEGIDDYAKALLQSDAVRKKAIEYALQEGVDLSSFGG